MTLPRMGYPETFGWVRAEWLDMPDFEAWESPDGVFRFAPKGRSFCVVRHPDGQVTIKLMRTKATS